MQFPALKSLSSVEDFEDRFAIIMRRWKRRLAEQKPQAEPPAE